MLGISEGTYGCNEQDSRMKTKETSATISGSKGYRQHANMCLPLHQRFPYWEMVNGICILHIVRPSAFSQCLSLSLFFSVSLSLLCSLSISQYVTNTRPLSLSLSQPLPLSICMSLSPTHVQAHNTRTFQYQISPLWSWSFPILISTHSIIHVLIHAPFSVLFLYYLRVFNTVCIFTVVAPFTGTSTVDTHKIIQIN